MSDEIIVREEWFDALVEDCKAIVTEAVFTHNWSLVEGYHQLGERIVTDSNYKKWEQGKAGVVLSDLIKLTGIAAPTIYRAIRFYEKYPDLSLLPEGKNVTWNKVITKYLPEEKEEEPPELITGGYYYLLLGMIKGAIRAHDREYLTDENTITIFETLNLPYQAIENWIDVNFQSMEDLLCGMMDANFVDPNIEEVVSFEMEAVR